MTKNKIRCRAQLVADCQNDTEWDDERGPLEDDGTYVPYFAGADDPLSSIVCDPCYAAIMPFTPSGAALSHEIDVAIGHYRAQVAAVRAAAAHLPADQMTAKRGTGDSDHPCLSCRLRGNCLGRIKGCPHYTGNHGTVLAESPGRYSTERSDAECWA